jgi:NADH:ubiquinone oxidoreductase subunit 4 (subunit M)
MEKSVEVPESEQPNEYGSGRSIGRWLFLATLASIVVALWALDLFPRILYVDTVGSIDNLLPMIPRIDIIIIVIIWMTALFFGLVGRGIRHASRARRS